ncbi:hypothetical protein [Actinokineospora sp. NBRC 105648]|uniref:hypothetical protein n=1 Tax=Actinokineospora sp. NBRC 105648 TaxID=3032206 RepID=UPI0024A36F55|nr:hypothetical protein [Actinokineospora sp. NBRC 105648]GLZ40084.1 hypothetical protein Acsp05_37080 [Actinokineospora sp. NBRC 105648]
MVPDVLVNLLASVLAGAAIVYARYLRLRWDPDNRVDQDEWQRVATRAGVSSLLVLGMTYVVALALSGLFGAVESYLSRVAESAQRSPNAPEAQWVALGAFRDIARGWDWAWSWPYVVGLLGACYLGYFAFLVVTEWDDTYPVDRRAFLVRGIAAGSAGVAVGATAGYFAHRGLDAVSRAAFAGAEAEVRAGRTNFYPADSLIQLPWPVQQSAGTVALVVGFGFYLVVAYRAFGAQRTG